MRILLVDAERSLHRGLEMRLEGEPDFMLVGLADSLSGAAETITGRKPDIVVVDPVGLGARPEVAIARLRRACQDCKLVVLSLQDDVESRERFLKAGASAFVSKHDSADRLLHVLRQLASDFR